MVFFDDILIYSKNEDDHLKHLQKVFEILKHNQYVLNRGKYVFAARKIEYLGHYISAEGVSTDPRKMKIVSDWPTLRTVKQVRNFLGMTGYYRRFIKGYGTLARPLTNLLKRGGFKWDEATEDSFRGLKEALTSTLVLALPDLSKPFTVETDVSQYGIGAVLLQGGHLVAYISKALSPKNQLLSVYDKELLALIHAVEKWHLYLSIQPFVIKTDQRSLRYLL